MKLLNKTIIHLSLIVFGILALYLQTLHFDFVLDDTIVIKENNFVKKGINGISEIFGNDSMTGYLGKQPNLLNGGRYRPLSLAVFALEYEIFGLNPSRFHLISILFYALSCALLYFMLKQLFHFSEKSIQKWYIFTATLLYAIHPVHTEAVANIKGLDEILAFLFGIVAFQLTLLHFDRKNRFVLAGIVLSLLLSFLAKESTLPLILAIPVALWFFRNGSLKTVFHYFLILLVPALLYLVIRYHALGYLFNNQVKVTGIMNNPFINVGVSQKYGTIFFVLLLYIKLLFFPHPLTHDYYPYQIKLLQIYQPLSLLSVFIFLFLIWVAIKGIKSRNKLAYVIFFFYITISIVSNVLINVGTFMNERFLFVPSLAFSLFILYLFEKFNQNKKIHHLLWIVVLLMTVGFLVQSLVRIPDWKNEKTLNKAAIQVSKNSARAQCFYAVSLYHDIQNEKDQNLKMEKIKEATEHINKSLSIYPEYSDALQMKAGLAAEEYKIDKDVDKLLQTFTEILEVKYIPYVDEFTDWLEPRTDKNKMADYYLNAGYNIFTKKHQNLTLALRFLQKANKLEPAKNEVLFANCVVNYLAGNNAKTIDFGNEYIKMYGDNAEILYYIGNAQMKSGEPQIGNQNIETAIQMNPDLKNKKE